MSRKRPLTPDDPRHGTIGGYTNYGCKCDACTAAHTANHYQYMQRGDHLEKHRLRMQALRARRRDASTSVENPTDRTAT